MTEKTEKTRLTREEALEMQRELIAEYGKPEFQSKLRYVLKETCSKEDKLKLDQELREVRENVGARFGFEASPEGVKKSSELFTPLLLADPEIASNCNVVSILLYPKLQDELKERKNVMIPKKMIQFLKSRAEVASQYEAEEAMRQKEKQNINKTSFFTEEIGRHWTVNAEKGVIVRMDEELHSQEFGARLANKSTVEELNLIGPRLHYKMLAGEGPDFGWVSHTVRGKTLLCPVPKDPKDNVMEEPMPEIV